MPAANIKTDPRKVRWIRYACPVCGDVMSSPIGLLKSTEALRADVLIDFVLCAACEILRPLHELVARIQTRPIDGPETGRPEERNAGGDSRVYFPPGL